MPDARTMLLIVDDEPSIRDSMAHMLCEIGYRVSTAEDGFSALVELRRETPSILLSDLNMPGMSGFELLSVVRRRFPAIQAIAMSGAFCGSEVPSGVAADAFFQKGSSMGALLRIIHALPQMERRDPRIPMKAPHLWVQPDWSGNGGEPGITLACPECLRTFSQSLGSSICQMRTAECIYCRTPIYYAIVPPAERGPLQPFQRPSAQTAPSHFPELYY